MTRSEESARSFWVRVDESLNTIPLQLKDIADATGLSYQSLTGWRHKNRMPDLEAAVVIADCLQVSLDYLATGKTVAIAVPENTRLYTINKKLRTADETTLQLVERVLQIEAPVSMEKRGLNIG